MHCHLYLVIAACSKQERLLEEAKKATETNIKENCVAPIKADALHNASKASTRTESLNAVTMSSPKLSSPSFIKKDKTQEGSKAGIIRSPMVNETMKGKQTGEETSDKVGKVGDMTPHTSKKNGLDKSETGLGQPNRPSNPFLKSTIK